MVWPNFWSSETWMLLHIMSFTYPLQATVDRQEATLSMLRGIFVNLPCAQCSSHALTYIDKVPIDLSNRDNFSIWMVEFHNEVNKRLNKRNDWTVIQAREALIDKYMSDGEELSRAELKRQEDHKYIEELKNTRYKNNNLELGLLIANSLLLCFLVVVFFARKKKQSG